MRNGVPIPSLGEREELHVCGRIRRLEFKKCVTKPGHLAFFVIHHEKSSGILPAFAFPEVVMRLRRRLVEGAKGTFLGHFLIGQDADYVDDWSLMVTGVVGRLSHGPVSRRSVG